MWRLRDITIDERAGTPNACKSARTQVNVQLTNVITDIAGETGMKIIRAIVAEDAASGTRTNEILAGACRHEQIAERSRALEPRAPVRSCPRTQGV